jgi:hypothetical protein
MSYTRCYTKRLHVASETVIYLFVTDISYMSIRSTHICLEFCVDVYLVVVHTIVINVKL